MTTTAQIQTLSILNKTYPTLPMQRVATTPYRTLIATLISQRARDDQTIAVCKELFLIADDPLSMLSIESDRLETILRPAGKQKQNARRIQHISKILIDEHDGRVPSSERELLNLPGVGRKTANIVLSHAFEKDAIAVDTHVHRISNRLGWIQTDSPEKTEETLKDLLPKRYWRIVNRVFVRHGQEVCSPISPKCSICPVLSFCKRVGVERS